MSGWGGDSASQRKQNYTTPLRVSASVTPSSPTTHTHTHMRALLCCFSPLNSQENPKGGFTLGLHVCFSKGGWKVDQVLNISGRMVWFSGSYVWKSFLFIERGKKSPSVVCGGCVVVSCFVRFSCFRMSLAPPACLWIWVQCCLSWPVRLSPFLYLSFLFGWPPVRYVFLQLSLSHTHTHTRTHTNIHTRSLFSLC